MIREEVWRWVSLADNASKNIPKMLENNKNQSQPKSINRYPQHSNIHSSSTSQYNNQDQGTSYNNTGQSTQSMMRVSELNRSQQHKEREKERNNQKYNNRENIDLGLSNNNPKIIHSNNNHNNNNNNIKNNTNNNNRTDQFIGRKSNVDML